MKKTYQDRLSINTPLMRKGLLIGLLLVTPFWVFVGFFSITGFTASGKWGESFSSIAE